MSLLLQENVTSFSTQMTKLSLFLSFLLLLAFLLWFWVFCFGLVFLFWFGLLFCGVILSFTKPRKLFLNQVKRILSVRGKREITVLILVLANINPWCKNQNITRKIPIGHTAKNCHSDTTRKSLVLHLLQIAYGKFKTVRSLIPVCIQRYVTIQNYYNKNYNDMQSFLCKYIFKNIY